MDAMEAMWQHIFKTNNLEDGEINEIVLSFPVQLSWKAIIETLFEKFRLGSIFIFDQAAGALYCSGRTTGLVIDSGESQTAVTSIYEV